MRDDSGTEETSVRYYSCYHDDETVELTRGVSLVISLFSLCVRLELSAQRFFLILFLCSPVTE